MKKVLFVFAALVLAFACKPEKNEGPEEIDWDSMGHQGEFVQVSGNKSGSIGDWSYELLTENGIGATASFYSNGTFMVNWKDTKTFMAEQGLDYGIKGDGVDVASKNYVLDYKFTKSGLKELSYGYVGVHGWIADPYVHAEFYIMDSWLTKERPGSWLGPYNAGEYTLDGDTYTVVVNPRLGPAPYYQNEPGDLGNQWSLQFFAVRKTERTFGTIHISEHFKKWNEMFHGQTVSLYDKPYILEVGKPAVLKFQFCGGNAATTTSGSADLTYFKLSHD